MKKSILIATAVLITSIVTQAQITISQSDVVSAGDVVVQANDTALSGSKGLINPGMSGGNQTWNFSILTDGKTDTLIFTTPGSTANGASFPSANLAAISAADTSVIYFNNGPTGFFIEGIFTNFSGPKAIKYNPTEELISFPDIYNASFKNTSRFNVEMAYVQPPYVDSIRISRTKITGSGTDAWGTVITPLGSYGSLRHKDTVITIDSVFVHILFPSPVWQYYAPLSNVDTVWHFSWWANNLGFPVVGFDSTANDTIQNVTWLKSVPTPLAVNELTELNSLHTYPNPASNQINFEIKEANASQLEITDMNGRKIALLPATKTNLIRVNTSEYVPGVYFYLLSDKNKNITSRGKFTIVK